LPDSRPIVSVFVQAYNTEAFVGECLESVLRQEGPYTFDVLVIDDASTDGTADEIARFRDARLRTVRHAANAGAIATANEGYAATTGAFVVRVDSDDRLRPSFLARTVPVLNADPRLGLVYGDVAMVDQCSRITQDGGLVDRHGLPPRGNEFFPLLLDNYIPAPATIMRREALAPLLPIPLRFRFLDWYLTTGITERWESAFVDDVLADYRVHSANMHRTMIQDRTGEATSREVLDALFANDIRKDEKRRWRARVYASHYLTYAEKYFGCDMNDDARRCYWQAARTRPSVLLAPGPARRFAGVLLGRRAYEAAKGMVR
jgi:glycosyltransferase involved in cell wall biosynthesis